MAEHVVQYLARFINLSDEEFGLLAGMLHNRTLDTKEKLIKIGEVEKHIYFVAKGILRKYFYRGKEEVVTHIAKEHSIISSSVSFLKQQPSDYILEAIEPSKVIYIHYDDLEKLYATHHKYERMGRLVTIDWLLNKESLENERLQLSSRDRFLKFAQENPDLMERVPQKYLASFLNIQPETFSRYKHLLKL